MTMSFSEDQIEAAARVFWQFNAHQPWEQARPTQHDVYRQIARSALTAAERVRHIPPALPKIVRGRERYSDWITPAHLWAS